MTTDATTAAPTTPELSFARRWMPVVLAACFINTSYGTLSYAFSVLVTESSEAVAALNAELGADLLYLCFADPYSLQHPGCKR